MIPQATSDRLQKNLLFIIFMMSGFSGLIYESIWSHYLKLFLGHAAYAQTLVLAIFMGGMALGSWLCSKFTLKWKNLLLLYAVAEAVIGVFAIIFHESFNAIVSGSYNTIFPALGTPLSINTYKWVVSALMILPQSILLGMTFPLMSAGIIRRFPATPGASIALLYFCNSLGAAVGVLASGFVMIKHLGLPGTVFTAGLINIALALLVYLMAGKRQCQPEMISLENIEPVKPGEHDWRRVLLITALLTGCASFIYEIGWIRMLSLVLGSSTHAFELMLSAFIFGLAFGGLWIKRRIDKIGHVVGFLAGVQIVMGVLALVTLPLYNWSFDLMREAITNLSKTDQGYTLYNIFSHALSLMIMLPATFCAGMTLPLITYALLRRGYGERSIGAVYAVNTVGAIAGVFLTVHLFMPLLGLKAVITIGAAIDIMLGMVLYLLLFKKEQIAISRTLVVLGVVAIILTAGFVRLDGYKMASGVYRSGSIMDAAHNEIIYHRDGKTASIDLIRYRGNRITISTNGKPDAQINMSPNGKASADEATMILAAVTPLAHNPEAKRAAVIGMGSGLSSNTLLLVPGIRSVDTIEIEAAMVEAANGFRPRVERVYTDPRSHIYIEDAKTYFAGRNIKYDIILSEPSNPWVSGVAGLFSIEFYTLIRKYLNRDGVLVQWVQLYEIDIRLVATIIKALEQRFSDYIIYTPDNVNMLIVAKKHGKFRAIDNAIFNYPLLRKELNHIGILSMQDLGLRRLGSRRTLGPLFRLISMPANSDYYPVLDQHAAKTRFLGKNAHGLVALGYSPLPLLEMLGEPVRSYPRTRIHFVRFLRRPRLVHRAMIMRDYLLERKSEKRTDISQIKEIEFIRLLINHCSTVPHSRSLIGSIQLLSQGINNTLQKHERMKIWRRIVSNPCMARLPLRVQRLILLSQSIAGRDAEKMLYYADLMLKDSYFSARVWRSYLLKTAMLASISLQKKQKAMAYWRYYSPGLGKKYAEDLEFLLLLAHARKDF